MKKFSILIFFFFSFTMANNLSKEFLKKLSNMSHQEIFEYYDYSINLILKENGGYIMNDNYSGIIGFSYSQFPKNIRFNYEVDLYKYKEDTLKYIEKIKNEYSKEDYLNVKKTLTYEEIKKEQVKYLTKKTFAYSCNRKDFQILREKGISIVHSFFDSNGINIQTIDANSSNCELFNKLIENEIR